jgi:hypothetical protein
LLRTDGISLTGNILKIILRQFYWCQILSIDIELRDGFILLAIVRSILLEDFNPIKFKRITGLKYNWTAKG